MLEGMIPVSGYSLVAPGASELFVRLKRLGANWHSRRRVWEIPEDKLSIALSLSPKLKAEQPVETPPQAPTKPPEAAKPSHVTQPPSKPPEAATAPQAPAPEPVVLKPAEGELSVSGPGIDLLKNTWEMMASRGAPNEKNDYGFAKGHYDLYTSMKLHAGYHADALPMRMAKKMLDSLVYYSRTQLADRWDKLLEMVRADFKKAEESQGAKQNAHTEGGGKKIYVYNADPRPNNRVKVYIPSYESVKKKINKFMDDHFASKNFPMELDNFGQTNYSKRRWINFRKDETQLDIYWINEKILPSILDLLKAEGFEIAYQDDAKLSEKPGRPKLKILGQENTDYGPKLLIAFYLEYEKSSAMMAELRNAGLWPGGIVYKNKDARGVASYRFSLRNKSEMDKTVDILRQYVDVAELEQELQKRGITTPTEQQPEVGQTQQFGFSDKGGNKMSIKTPYTKDENKRALMKQIVRYNFPESYFDFHGTKTWEVEGDFQQYIMMKKLLERYKWDTTKLNEIIEAKIRTGGLSKEPIEGDISPGFEEKIEEALSESAFDLNQPQKEGISFLCHRKSAILGDETGFGKTVQLVSAAEIKMRESGYRGDTLIIVPLQGGAIIEQWKDTIIKVIGEKNAHLISTEWNQPKRWTILWYDMFSISERSKDSDAHAKNIAKRDAILKSLQDHKFLIVIFDELHKVKDQKALKSQNIQKVVDNIPIHWGASATISSNKPKDVRNQLVMVAHHLGRIGEGVFKREFAGEVPKGFNNSYVPGDIEDQIKAAENLNKWLNITGLYVRRSKDDVKAMPGISITQHDAQYDPKEFDRRLADHIPDLKDPKSVISILGAAREELAIAKVPATVAKAAELIKQGRKVVIFTAFPGGKTRKRTATPAGEYLKNGLRQVVKNINPDWDILTYTSDTPKKDLAMVKERFTNDQRYRAVLMSLKMGGTGIDFPNVAQNMIINDYDWTPEQAEQSEGRIYRITTEKPVNIEYMVIPGTIDEPLYQKVQQKRELASIIQRYRKDYQDDKEPEKSLEKIIMFRKQLEALDAEIKALRRQAAEYAAKKAGIQSGLKYDDD